MLTAPLPHAPLPHAPLPHAPLPHAPPSLHAKSNRRAVAIAISLKTRRSGANSPAIVIASLAGHLRDATSPPAFDIAAKPVASPAGHSRRSHGPDSSRPACKGLVTDSAFLNHAGVDESATGNKHER
jgi:hypothetical protein